jgi:hypothetical protein
MAFLNLRFHLQTKYGLTSAQFDAAVGATAVGKTQKQTEQMLTTWARTLPKGP